MNINQGSIGIYLTLMFLMEILSILATITSLQLIIFHTYLAFKKLTTYEYILQKRNKYIIPSDKNSSHEIEEIPLEEVYEPYIKNPQYKLDLTQTEITKGKKSKRIVPSKEAILNENKRENSS